MARNDGIDRTVARNQDLGNPADVAKVQEHNEREKDSYSNQDIVPERTSLNVHFKAPTDDYVKMFEQMEQDGVISTRGLKPDAVKYGELVFDVNSAYFYNHGGYEFAKQFYADAYKAAAEIVGGEQYILSAVMHADERNRAMSEALGEDRKSTRLNSSHSNQDIVPERTSLNVHFKASTDDYVKMFEQMEQDGVISTRGLKPDAVKYGELIFDVNSAYFYNHGGYEFAKQFYADAYKAAAEIVGG